MLSAYCMSCLVKRQLKMLDKFDDEEKKARYMRDALSIIGGMKSGEAAPVAVNRMDRLFVEYFGEKFSFEAEKKKYNDLILEREDEIYSKIKDFHGDKILLALKYARIGNYIDFGALNSVEDERLSSLIEGACDEEIDPVEYANFRRELDGASRMVYLTDNCGEIVFDKIFIRILKEEYPGLDLRVIVRGEAVLNDATVRDAKYVGIDKYAPVIGNGSGIAGNFLPEVSDEALGLIDSADLILAKGQGNFETMLGCGRNVYYAFLCKCEWFVRRFGMKRLEGVFANDLRCPFNGSTV